MRIGLLGCAGSLAYPFHNQDVHSHAGNLTMSSWKVDGKEKQVELSLALCIWNG